MRLLLFSIIFLFSTSTIAQSWQDVGGGTNNSSHGMLVWDGKLINLGSYNNPCQRVSAWDGTSWTCLGGGVGIVARAGCVWNGKLVVVGDFWNNFQPCAGCNGVAVWDGVSWSALDQGFNNDVLTCTVYNGDLIIGGDFTQANGVPITRVARWNDVTQTFESMGGAATIIDNDVRCMTVYDGELWIGGDFNNIYGQGPLDGVVKWDETNQVWVGGNSGVDLIGGVNETVRVLYVNPTDGNLYMGGEFPELWDGDAAAEDYNMAGVAMYDGSNWYPLGTGLEDATGLVPEPYCRAMQEYNGDLIIGGYFTSAGGVPAQKIVKWNPITQTYTAMGGGFDGVGVDEYVKSAAVWNGILFAGGAYTQAEGGPMNYIAQWYEAPTNPPVASFSPSTNSGCEGVCVDFTDASANNPTSWAWTFNGASTTSSSQQNPMNICYPSAGTYNVQLIACNGNGCDTTVSQITVQSTPTVSVSDQSICEGETATLTAVPSQTGGNYVWSPGGQTGNSISVSPTTTTTYTVDYSLNGCSSPQATVTVTVTATPTIAITGSSNAICEGESVSVSATPSISGGTYNWLPNGETTGSITDSPATSTVYSVEYTYNGCTSSQETFGVTVNPVYNLSESLSVCPGDNVTYPDGTSETITGGTVHTSSLSTAEGCDSIIVTTVSVYPTYSNSESAMVCNGDDYAFPDGSVQTITTATTHVSNLTTQDGCDSTITTTVDVYADPGTTETVDVCSGGSHTYPDGTVSSNITVDESHTSILQSSLGCDSTVITNVTVTSGPDTSITQLNKVLSASQSGATYQWIDCAIGQPISGETGSSFAPQSNGSYAVIVSLSGCSDTSSCHDVTTLGVLSYEASFKVFPNPSNGQLTIESSQNLTGKMLHVLDNTGRLVLSEQVDATHLLDLQGISAGNYVLSIEGLGVVRVVLIE